VSDAKSTQPPGDDAVEHPPADSTSDSGPDSGEDPAAETRRRFREALERKKAAPGTHPGSQAAGNTTLKGSNGKRKREFRRKSG
jgi:Family of unknown function (DUF5302)